MKPVKKPTDQPKAKFQARINSPVQANKKGHAPGKGTRPYKRIANLSICDCMQFVRNLYETESKMKIKRQKRGKSAR
jgi:hypothetical protein